MQNIELSQVVLSVVAKVNSSTITRRIALDNTPAIDATAARKRYKLDIARHFMHGMFQEKFADPLRKIHVFYNFKGGTGKTTVCYQTASMLHLMGYKVLVIDCDPQAHLTNALGFAEDEKFYTIYDVMVDGIPISEAVSEVYEGFHTIAANLGLTRIEVPLSQKTRREEILTRCIMPLKDMYDFILIDTNPTISTLNMNALFCADHVNIVCETQPFSLAGLGILVEELEKIFQEMQRPFMYSIIANKYEAKTATAQEVLGVLRTDYKENMNDTVLRKSEDINISSKRKLPIFAFANKNSAAFEDFIDYAHEFLEISGQKRK